MIRIYDRSMVKIYKTYTDEIQRKTRIASRKMTSIAAIVFMGMFVGGRR